jgi:hypothetical protein
VPRGQGAQDAPGLPVSENLLEGPPQVSGWHSSSTLGGVGDEKPAASPSVRNRPYSEDITAISNLAYNNYKWQYWQ